MRKSNFTYYICLAIIVIDIPLLYYLKYRMNDISFSNFSLSFIGNIINLIFSLGVAAGLIILIFSKKELLRYRKVLIFILSLLIIIPHLILLFKLSAGYTLPKGNFLNYPLEKAFVAFLFILAEISKISLMFYTWSRYSDTGKWVFIKSMSLTAATAILLSAISFIYTIGFKNPDLNSSSGEKYDIAVVLGAAVWSDNKPSTVFKGRLEKAFQLYNMGLTDKIQVTGGNAPGELSEAEVGYNYLKNLGLDTGQILIETYTSTTSDQVKFIKENLVAKLGYNKIIIVSDQFHIRRVMEMCKFFDIKAQGVTSDYNVKFENLIYYRIRDSIGLMLFWLFGI